MIKFGISTGDLIFVIIQYYNLIVVWTSNISWKSIESGMRKAFYNNAK